MRVIIVALLVYSFVANYCNLKIWLGLPTTYCEVTK